MIPGTDPSLTPSAHSAEDRPASPCVRHEWHGRALVIRMEREAKRNAIDQSTTRGIDEALNLLEDDDQLWAGVITGTTAVFRVRPVRAAVDPPLPRDLLGRPQPSRPAPSHLQTHPRDPLLARLLRPVERQAVGCAAPP